MRQLAQKITSTQPRMPRSFFLIALSSLCLLLLALGLVACDSGTAKQKQIKTIQQAKANKQVTYSVDPQDVVIRTLYGGGLKGSLSLSPVLSIYGDGTYILGTERTGKLTPDALQQLLDALVNTYDLPDFSQKQFIDIQDLNATYLQLALNNQQTEFAYGSFGYYQPKAQELDEYTRLGKALTAINNAVNATSSQPYKASTYALLARRTFSADPQRDYPFWPLSDYTLEQAATYECGSIPPNENTPNLETPCLKFTIPSHALLLNHGQYQSLKASLNGNSGTMSEAGLYYTLTLRPLLPDETQTKALAMFGSQQTQFTPIPLAFAP
ncbi:hypothetical protein KSC_045300 [Ktedonobacter sp. SOSP1-52]|uniref:hypothetical protein n=1 Tax=Ktedonobacter sp. SOSP1-52 TaxID=2778366 RepID=UPI00191504D2|nr:hypothetical protein [Ktedonobacter sp. SOSP1-52]GHO65638.1 hypothetical protein KSC_045300 [Ktedonobacter sp. SOSP1-52]